MADTELSKVADPKTHYGSPKEATRTFKLQRLTGMLNVAFAIFFVWFVVRLAGADRVQMVEVVRNPIVAVIVCAMIIVVAVHMRIGMNEVIEDYIEDHASNQMARGANLVFAVLVALATVAAVAKIVFWG